MPQSDLVSLQETRCPFCHETVAIDDEQYGCNKCRAWHHQECWVEHRGCSACNFVDASLELPKEQLLPFTRRDPTNLNGYFKQAAEEIKSFPEFAEVYSIVKSNVEGHIYLVGGKVYRTLACTIHRNDEPGIYGEDTCDWDFLVEGFKGRANKIPDQWCYKVYDVYDGTSLANPYQISKDAGLVRWNKKVLRREQYVSNKDKDQDEVLCKIDIMNINKVRFIPENKMRPRWYQFWKKDLAPTKVDDYFRAVPMNIQAITFDPKTETFNGPGIETVVNQKIQINNLEAMEALAKREKLEISDLLRSKAKSMPGFKWDMKLKK